MSSAAGSTSQLQVPASTCSASPSPSPYLLCGAAVVVCHLDGVQPLRVRPHQPIPAATKCQHAHHHGSRHLQPPSDKEAHPVGGTHGKLPKLLRGTPSMQSGTMPGTATDSNDEGATAIHLHYYCKQCTSPVKAHMTLQQPPPPRVDLPPTISPHEAPLRPVDWSMHSHLNHTQPPPQLTFHTA